MTIKDYIWYPSEVLRKSSTLSAIALRDVGHVSMEVKDTYISHRPSPSQDSDSINFLEYFAQFVFLDLSVDEYRKNRAKNFYANVSQRRNSTKDNTKKYIRLRPVKSADSISYDEECKNKRRDADKIIFIEGLNEERILKCYNNQKDSMYHPFKNNCCTFIANVLRESLDCTSELCGFCSLRFFHSFNSLFAKDAKIVKRRIKEFILILDTKLIFFMISPIVSIPTIILSTPIIFLILVNIIFSLNIPVWTPKLIEEFISLIDDNSEKICLKNQLIIEG